MAKKSDLIPRVITAVIALPALIALITLAPHWGFFALVLVAGAIAVWEFCGITYADEHPTGRLVTVALSMATFSLLYIDPFVDIDLILPTLAGAIIALFTYFLFDYRDQPRVSHYIGSSVTGLFYGAVLFGFIAFSGRDFGDAGPLWVLMTLALVWASDTGAYFAGRFLGKRKLYESVSPNKSIEGAIGGLLGSIAFVFIFDAIFNHFAADAWHSLSIGQVLLLAIPANFLGQVGDLIASLFKRAHDVKDSGTIIYGHGGILDRIDALILASPWVYFFATYFVA